MTNTLNLYDPLFYAQEAILQLHKALGLAGRVHRGYDKTPQQKGSTIMINIPSTFVATDVNTSTGGTTQDLKPASTSVVLDQWKEVKFALTDKELTFTGEQIINDHITPAAYALADKIDQTLAGLYKGVPWKATMAGSTMAVADILALRKQLFDNKVPLNDGNIHVMLDSTSEAELLALTAFSQNQGAGNTGVNTQMTGYLGQKYGMEFFANQNTISHTSGGDADVAGVAGAALIGATTMNVTSVGASAPFKAGDTFTIAGHTQHYVLTADATASTGTITAMTFSPGLEVATAGSEVLTFEVPSAGATKTEVLAFHRNAFCLAMAPLSEMGNNLGARIASVSDPVSNLSLRSRLFYDAEHSTIKVALDVLFGVKTLDGNKAMRQKRQ